MPITVLHIALTQPVTYGLVIVCVHLDIKEEDARTVSVFVVMDNLSLFGLYLTIISGNGCH